MGTVFDRLSPEAQGFALRFKEFSRSLNEVASEHSAYTMSPDEVFARFVDQFCRWTESIATGNTAGRVAYGDYNDKFTNTHYIKFAKLLQEMSALENNGLLPGNANEEHEQYSVRTYDGDITVREFMRSMDTSELTVQEKKAYAAYTAQYDKVQDISSKLIEQQNLAAVSVSQDERVAAQNRADILQKQLMRESQTLYRMESSKGAAWMLRDARMLEEYLWSSESTDVNMMISDLNAKL